MITAASRRSPQTRWNLKALVGSGDRIALVALTPPA
jgi:hypothetical protein